ncbi:hypothetical protein [Aeromonas veronii]|jgi:hypothetical protein|uniref:hypothetical protein n=1 Tax=Aeromonas veronii TaxID=654 RepID=UPI003D25C384
MNSPMSKQEMFLWAIQTYILTNSINCAAQDGNAPDIHAEISATGISSIVDLALYVSDKIPDDISAAEAAQIVYFSDDDDEPLPGWACYK